MKHKVSELQGATLDAAVGMALGVKPRRELVAVKLGCRWPDHRARANHDKGANERCAVPFV